MALCGMTLGIFPISIFAETIEAADVVINQVKITDTEDQEISENNRVKRKDKIKIKLKWSQSKPSLIEGNTRMSINLPKNLNYPDQSGSLGEIGNYQVSNQQLIFQFNKNYQESEDGRVPDFSSAKFYKGVLELTAETTSKELETEDVDFGNNLISTLYYDQKANSNSKKIVEAETEKVEKAIPSITQPRALNNNLNDRGVKLFDAITITDENGNAFTDENPAKYNDNIKIHIDWSLLDSVDITNGDYYEYKLPDSFAVHNPVDEILKNGGQELGRFQLDTTGNLKVIFNQNAENLSNRKGKIDLSTSFNIQTNEREVEIETGIYDNENKEIIITVPIFQIDFSKSGEIKSNGTVNWNIDFNKDSNSITKVVVTDVMPEGLGYIASKGLLFKNGKWEETANLYTYNPVAQTFTFNDIIKTPVRLTINAYVDQKKTTIDTYTNTAKITGSEFLEQDASATVSFKDVDNYKRFISYTAETGEAKWEVSATFTKENGILTDKTYAGLDSEGALHYLVEDSVVITKKQDGSSVSKDSWKLESTTKNSSGNTVAFEIKFKDPGSYIVSYKTKMAKPTLSDTKIDNYMSVVDDGNKSDHSSGGTVTPETGIGVDKAVDAANKDVDKMILAWSAEINKAGKTINNLIVTDIYEMANGSNVSALSLIKDELVIKTVSGKVLNEVTDYKVEILTRQIPGTSEMMESGFKITFKNTVTEKLMISYKTKFDINKQNELKESGKFPSVAGNRFSNTLFAEYLDENGDIQKVGDQAEQWISSNWLKNADKGGFFVKKGENVHEAMKKFLKKNNLSFNNIFEEAVAPEDSVYWIAKFNLFKNKIPKKYKIIDTLGEGQVLRKLAIYETTLNRDGDLTEKYERKLELGEDYEFEEINGDIVITLLKETDKTLSVAVAVDTDEDSYKYKNYAELQNGDGKKIVSADAEVNVSLKEDWLTKDGLQNEANNRLVDWQVVINKDAKKIHNATIMDTVKLNQQTFILDENNEVLVKVFKGIKNGNNFEKGEEVSFSTGKGAMLLTDSTNGTQSLKIEFDEYIEEPYIIEYQTKLDPGIVNSEKITNDVNLSGGKTEIHKVIEEVIVKSTDGSGTSSGVNGSLIIHKIDSSEKKPINDSAFFNIYRKNGEGIYEIFIPNLEVKNNKIVTSDGSSIEQLSNLRYGTYAIQEEIAPDGYVKDDKLYEFTIDSNNQTYTFTLENKKKANVATDITLEAKKVLSGRKLKTNEFSFNLRGSEDKINQTKKNDSDGNIAFDKISYEKEGTYTYTISEIIPAEAEKEIGMTYDDTQYKVTVTVEENAGKLEARAVYENVEPGKVPEFNNIYLLPDKPTANIAMEARKELTGRELKANEFSFNLKGENIDQTVKNDSEGKILFDSISYDKAGIYKYTISEAIPADTEKETGMIYDDTKQNVTVTVEENAGKLEAVIIYEKVESGKVPIFKNKYKALPTSIELEAQKKLTGRELQDEEFSFNLKGENVDQTVKNDKKGKVEFTKIDYNKAGTYEYTISEVIPSQTASGIIYDDTKQKVTVTVEEKSGNLEARAVYKNVENGKIPIFKNTYLTPNVLPAKITLAAQKELSGRSLRSGDFSFKLKGKNVDQTVKNDEQGKITFQELSYDKVGVYEYTIVEVIPAEKEPGMSYDKTEYKVMVTVEEKNGKLEAAAVYENIGKGKVPVFKNEYKVLPTSVKLEAQKKLTGRTLKDQEFSFKLKGEGINQIVENSVDGKITFDEINYSKSGTYNYTISEVIPGKKDSTITYDDTEFKVMVKVEEKAEKLEAKVIYSFNESTTDIPTFKNLYTPEKKVPAGEILLKKVDSQTGQTLAGAEFKLVNNKGQQVTGHEKIVTSEDGTIFIKGLTDGDYKLFETKAPKGYQLDETPINFTVKNNQPSKKEINKENTRIGLPATGDSYDTKTNVQKTYRNSNESKSMTSKRLPSTGSIQSSGLILLGLLFLAMSSLVVFGRHRKV